MSHTCKSFKKKTSCQGRYKDISLAPISALSLPAEHDDCSRSIRHALIENPDALTKGQRQRTAVNIKTDALEQEYAYHRISDAAYRAGRYYQKHLEYTNRQSSLGHSWSSAPRVDVSRNPEARFLYTIEKAEKAAHMLDETRPIIGLLGERLLCLVLRDGFTLSQAASHFGDKGDLSTDRKGKHITSLYAWQFRQTLETLAEHWKKWH